MPEARRIQSLALVVRIVEYGESDVIATLVTETHGKVAAVVRGARKGSRRLGGALEPIHTVEVVLEDRGGDLATLKEARIARVREGLVSRLEALDAAGTALRWVRHLLPPRTPEPEVWRTLIDLLDALDRPVAASPEPAHDARAELARAGLRLLAAVGYGLELERCVVCGRPCPVGKPACIDAARGGLVCRSCGGAPVVLEADALGVARAIAAGVGVEGGALNAKDAAVLLRVVDSAMATHAGFER
jgi:DNA repair protein RecO (recombination protein O)